MLLLQKDIILGRKKLGPVILLEYASKSLFELLEKGIEETLNLIVAY